MNIVVCVKPVPDVSIISLDTDMGHIDGDDLVYIINPCDMVAVEKAVLMKEKDGVSQVTLVSMAPPSTKRLLRRCLAIGADEAILLWDNSFDNSDSYTTATILAKAIGSLQYDLVLCGQKAIDTEAGQVGGIIADMLGIPLVSRVVKVEASPSSKEVIVESKLEKGNREQIGVILPALLTVEVELDELRYASLPSLMASLKEDIKEYDLRALGLSYEEVGSKGSKTRVVSLSLPKPRPKKLFTPDSSLPAAERMRLVMSGGVTEKRKDLFEGSPKELSSKLVEFLKQTNILGESKTIKGTQEVEKA